MGTIPSTKPATSSSEYPAPNTSRTLSLGVGEPPERSSSSSESSGSEAESAQNLLPVRPEGGAGDHAVAQPAPRSPPRSSPRSPPMWDESATELLPSYIKGFYLYLLKTFHSFENELGPGKSHHVHYLKEALMRLVQAYTEELKWRDGNYVPKTLEEHLGVSARSSGGFTLASASLFAGVGGIATTDTFEWILNYPQLFKTFDMFVRFSNDIVSSQREQTGDHYASTIQCYMEEHGVMAQDACEKIKDLVEDSWKDMVRHCVASTEQQQPLAVPRTVVNFARTVNNMYKSGDAFTSSHEIKEIIRLLYVEPIA